MFFSLCVEPNIWMACLLISAQKFSKEMFWPFCTPICCRSWPRASSFSADCNSKQEVGLSWDVSTLIGLLVRSQCRLDKTAVLSSAVNLVAGLVALVCWLVCCSDYSDYKCPEPPKHSQGWHVQKVQTARRWGEKEEKIAVKVQNRIFIFQEHNSTGQGEELLVPLPLQATAWTPWSGTGWWSWWVHHLQPCETLWPKRWWPAPTLSTDRATTDSRSGTTTVLVATATSNCPVSPNNRVNHTMASLPQLSKMERNLKLFWGHTVALIVSTTRWL